MRVGDFVDPELFCWSCGAVVVGVLPVGVVPVLPGCVVVPPPPVVPPGRVGVGTLGTVGTVGSLGTVGTVTVGIWICETGVPGGTCTGTVLPSVSVTLTVWSAEAGRASAVVRAAASVAASTI